MFKEEAWHAAFANDWLSLILTSPNVVQFRPIGDMQKWHALGLRTLTYGTEICEEWYSSSLNS